MQLSLFPLLILLWTRLTFALLVQNYTYLVDLNNPDSHPICTLKPQYQSAKCSDADVTIEKGQIFQIRCANYFLIKEGCFLDEEYIDPWCASKCRPRKSPYFIRRFSLDGFTTGSD